MKTLLSCMLLTVFLFVSNVKAQQSYTVDGNSYSLFTEIEGPLTLLWNTIDGEYRYFSKKGNEILELKNTEVEGKYQEEYKSVLKLQTSDVPSADASKVKLTRPDLSNFFIKYNKAKDPNFTHEKTSIQLNTRLGAFAGISNSIFTSNPTNATTPVAGIDFEVVDEVRLKRHAMVFRFKQTFENSDTKSSFSQFSLNYRFKFVKTSRFDMFLNIKYLAYTYSKKEPVIIVNEDETTTTVDKSGGSFNTPASFGFGADYAIGNGYITFMYNDIVAIGVESNGEFPMDFTLGYKFNL